MKRALITGIAGQDGSYLAELLLSKGYEVYGLLQEGTDEWFVPEGAHKIYGDLSDFGSLKKIVQEIVPDEIYNFAGITDLKTAYADPEKTMRINCEAVGTLLDVGVAINPKIRFFQASSSEIFLPQAEPLNEGSPRDWQTQNPYARAKMIADRDFIEAKRKNAGVFACSGIFFNHESPRRPETSLLRKVTSTFAKIKKKEEECLEIGNVDAERDWGYAGDYVEAVWRMLQGKEANDFVIASGTTHSVREAIDTAATIIGVKLHWQGEGVDACAYDSVGKKVVTVDPNFYKPTEPYPKVGDIGKARRVIAWEPKTNFDSLIRVMIQAEASMSSQKS